MPKYYCDYCKSYLTHDTMSVRKSHLMGKNHIKLYCEYYEAEARKQNQWEQNKVPYEVNISDLYEGIPGKPAKAASERETSEVDIQGYLPPPPTLTGFPNPPPSIYHFDANAEKKKITEVMRKQIKEQQLDL